MQPLYVDNTLLRATALCDTASALRHVLGFAAIGEAHQLACGIAAHECLAEWARGREAMDALATYTTSYKTYSDTHALGVRDNPWYRLSWENTLPILAEWMTQKPMARMPFVVRPGMVECGFAVPLCEDGSVVFTGRYDALVQSHHDKCLYVLDHKTTGRLDGHFARKWRTDSQMSGYMWAAQQTLGQRVTGIYINAIEFKALNHSEKKCPTHAVPYAECATLHVKFDLLVYTRTPEQLEQWRVDALTLARKFQSLSAMIGTGGLPNLHKVPMTGTFHGACGYCDFEPFCSVGRPITYTSGMLEYKPWQPFKIA